MRLEGFQLIDENFRLHLSAIPEACEGMKVYQLEGLTVVDSGLDCDTFNVIHIYDVSKLNKEILKDVIDHFAAPKKSYCIWINQAQLNEEMKQQFKALHIIPQGGEVGMIMDLQSYTSEESNYENIRQVDTSVKMKDYSTVIANNWIPADQNVITYYEQTASLYLESKVMLFIYYHKRKAVSTLEMYPTDQQTIGLYGFTTLAAYRAMGIGSSLMRFALRRAKKEGYKQAVLQATEDGIGIYKKYGFRPIGMYYEYAPA